MLLKKMSDMIPFFNRAYMNQVKVMYLQETSLRMFRAIGTPLANMMSSMIVNTPAPLTFQEEVSTCLHETCRTYPAPGGSIKYCGTCGARWRIVKSACSTTFVPVRPKESPTSKTPLSWPAKAATPKAKNLPVPKMSGPPAKAAQAKSRAAAALRVPVPEAPVFPDNQNELPEIFAIGSPPLSSPSQPFQGYSQEDLDQAEVIMHNPSDPRYGQAMELLEWHSQFQQYETYEDEDEYEMS